MKLTQELIDVFLTQEDEFSYALHRFTVEILLVSPESMKCEAEIDWDVFLSVFPRNSTQVDRFDKLTEQMKEKIPGVYLTGAYSIPDCIDQGEVAVASVLKYLKS